MMPLWGELDWLISPTSNLGCVAQNLTLTAPVWAACRMLCVFYVSSQTAEMLLHVQDQQIFMTEMLTDPNQRLKRFLLETGVWKV
jgi:hypothetical protein